MVKLSLCIKVVIVLAFGNKTNKTSNKPNCVKLTESAYCEHQIIYIRQKNDLMVFVCFFTTEISLKMTIIYRIHTHWRKSTMTFANGQTEIAIVMAEIIPNKLYGVFYVSACFYHCVHCDAWLKQMRCIKKRTSKK